MLVLSGQRIKKWGDRQRARIGVDELSEDDELLSEDGNLKASFFLDLDFLDFLFFFAASLSCQENDCAVSSHIIKHAVSIFTLLRTISNLKP